MLARKKLFFALILFIVALLLLIIKDPEIKHEYLRTEGVVFGTTYHITYASPEGRNLDTTITKALKEIDYSLSMFNEESTISRINRNDTTVFVDSLFKHLFNNSQKVSQRTKGAFDITVAPLVNLWGFGFKKQDQVTPEKVDSLLLYVDYSSVQIIGNQILKQHEKTMLDASAIAKGYACDHVANALREQGVENLLVEIGGEVTALGVNQNGNLWRIGINKPIEDSTSTVSEIQRIVTFSNAGMATSGNYRNFYIKDGKKFSHTINPKTGYPVEHSLLSATIIAPDCMTADAYATACMVMGLESALELCNNDSNIAGFFIYDNHGTITEVWSDDFPIE